MVLENRRLLEEEEGQELKTPLQSNELIKRMKEHLQLRVEEVARSNKSKKEQLLKLRSQEIVHSQAIQKAILVQKIQKIQDEEKEIKEEINQIIQKAAKLSDYEDFQGAYQEVIKENIDKYFRVRDQVRVYEGIRVFLENSWDNLIGENLACKSESNSFRSHIQHNIKKRIQDMVRRQEQMKRTFDKAHYFIELHANEEYKVSANNLIRALMERNEEMVGLVKQLESTRLQRI